MQNIYFDVTSLMTAEITGVGVYTKQLYQGLQSLNCPVRPVYKLSRFKKRNLIKNHIDEKALAFLPGLLKSGFLHGTDFKLLSSSKKNKTILTIHDLAVYREDLLELDFCKSGQKKIETELLKRPNAIIVPTKFVKGEFLKRFPEFENQVHSVYHGCDHIPVTMGREQSHSSSEPFFLYVGRIEKRKNVKNLIVAFEDFCKNNDKVNLSIVGSPGFGAEEIYSSIESSPFKSRIKLFGYVSGAELNELYQNALAFVYPSLYEGFGIPIIEAMRMGLPTLTSSFGAMKEVAGDGSFLIDTNDRENFHLGLVKLSDDQGLREKLYKAAKNRASFFTWKQSASETLKIYNSLRD